MNVLNEILILTIPFGFSMVLTFALLPVWISICNKWDLFDEPDNRKHHAHLIPSMGGIAMFAGIFLSFLLFANIQEHIKMQYLFGGALVLFFTGFFDDLMTVNAGKKFLFQLIAATIIYYGGFRIFTVLGFANIGEIPMVIGFPLTLIVITTFTNAYNFIDGTDGLAASIGIIISASLGMMFLIVNKLDFAVLAFCLSGSLVGFLFYNFYPAKIFMGDTGSLIVGFLLITMAIELYKVIVTTPELGVNPAIVAAILFVPIYDIARVIIIRMLKGNSLFRPDRNHLHHKLMSFGFGHGGITLFICAFTSSIILLQQILNQYSMFTFLIIATIYTLVITNFRTLKLMGSIRIKFIKTFSSLKV